MNIYLAAPYSSPDPNIREQRFNAACKYAAQLMMEGHNVFSPLSHSHPISLHMDNSLDHDFWLKQDKSFLNWWADIVFILMLPGWKKSEGIEIERKYALERNIPVRKVRP